jgi:hypothetical protein
LRSHGNPSEEEDMNRRLLSVTILIAAAASTFASVAAGDGGQASPGVEILSTGVLAPGGKTRYVAIPDGSRTVIAHVLVRNGSVLRFLSVRGQYGVPFVANDGSIGGLSSNGRMLVLAQASIGNPSRFVVVDTKRLQLRKVIVLHGRFAFDDISPDRTKLYVIEILSPPTTYVEYRVRLVDVASGRLDPRIIVDRRAPSERMSGYPVTRAASADGTWAFTLYQKADGSAFIHALDTRRAGAACIDLPWKSAAWILVARLQVSRDGTKLYLRRRGAGRPAAVVDTRTWAVKT